MKEEFHLSGESNQLRQKIIECLKRGTNSSKKYVVVQFYVNRILKVDDVNESVHLDLYLKLNWVSPMWIGKTDDEFQADEEKFNADRYGNLSPLSFSLVELPLDGGSQEWKLQMQLSSKK